MKITEKEKEIRKTRILYAAFKLFCQQGIEQVTLADIAKEAKVGNTSVYRYFKNKPLLVKETLSVLWKELSIRLEENATSTKDYDNMTGCEQLKVQMDVCRSLYLDNSEYVLFSYETKLYLARNNIKLTRLQYDNLMFEIKTPCMEAIEKGKADGSIPSTVDSEDLFFAIWGAIRSYIMKIVVYNELCYDGGPWKERYHVLEKGLLSALAAGWHMPQENI